MTANHYSYTHSQSDAGHCVENMVVPDTDTLVETVKLENIEVPADDTVVKTSEPVSILRERGENVDANVTPAKVIFSTDTDSDDSAICLKNDTVCPPSLDKAPAPGT